MLSGTTSGTGVTTLGAPNTEKENAKDGEVPAEIMQLLNLIKFVFYSIHII